MTRDFQRQDASSPLRNGRAVICRRARATVGALLAGSAFLANAAGAQAVNAVSATMTPTAEPQDVSPADIVVTAQKRSQRLSDVPISVTAISGAELTARGVEDIQGLAKLTPGLSYIDSGASIPVYSLRGVGFFDTSLAARPAVSVYTDEVPLPFSAMTVGSSFDLERVEVLKGPQGTLFGQNATGGAINYIAAKPTGVFKKGLDLSYGRFNTVDLQGFVSGPISDTLEVRVAGRMQRGDDWQYSYTRNDTLGRREFYQGRALADWRPSPTLKFELQLSAFNDRSDTQASQFIAFIPATPALAATRTPALIGYPVAPRDDRAADWDDNTSLRKDNRFYQGSLRSEFELSPAIKLTSITAYSHLALDQTTDQDGTALTNTMTNQNGRISSFSQELRLSGSAKRLTWLTGFNYEHDKSTENNVFSYPYGTTAYALGAFGTIPILRQLVDEQFDTYAAFANLDYEVLKQITLHGGVRYTQANLGYSACSADYNGVDVVALGGIYNFLRGKQGLAPLPPLARDGCISINSGIVPGAAQGSLNEHNVSWRGGIDWKPRSGMLVYFNVSRGYKAGSLPVVNALSQDEFTPIKQESVLAYELGAKAGFLNRTVNFAGAIFYYDYSNKQLQGRILTNPNLFGPLQALVDVPKSHIQGAELQVDTHPYRGLTLSVGAIYIESNVDSDFTSYTILGTSANFRGETFPYTPKYQLTADAEYGWSVGPKLRAFAASDVSYRSRTKAGFGAEEVLDIDAYTLVDLRLGIGASNDRWRATIFGRNVGNTYYWTNVAKVGDVARRLTGQPATYGVQVSLRW